MNATRFSVPLFLSFFAHFLVFALSPGDLSRHGSVGGNVPSVRLRVIGPGSFPRVGTAKEDAGERQLSVIEARGDIEKKKVPGTTRMKGKTGPGEGNKRSIGSSREGRPENTVDELEKVPEVAGREDEKNMGRVLPDRGKAMPEGVTKEEGDLVSTYDERGDGVGVSLEERFPQDAAPVGEGKDRLHTPPVLAFMPEPKYPAFSRMHGEEGVVMLSVAVDKRGRGREIEVVRSSGYGYLDRAAISALQKARFAPAREKGRAVSSVKRIAIRFSLKD